MLFRESFLAHLFPVSRYLENVLALGRVENLACLDELARPDYDSFTINFLSMSELTKEHFEETLKAAIDPLATAEDLRATERRLMKHADDLQGELARMVAEGFNDVQHRLDLRKEVDAHERKFQKLEEALHIKL